MRKNKYLNALAFSLSAASYFVACFTENYILLVIGMPFFLNFIILFHEAGHAICGLINGNKIKEIKIPFVSICNRRIQINTEPNFNSYCSFKKSENDAIVYAGGPICSLLLVWVLLLICVLSENNGIIISTIIATLHWAKNLIPLKDSDANMIIRELKKRRNSGK
jgi:hypothetical protein